MRIHQITVLRDEQRIKMTVEMPDLNRYLTSQVPNLPRTLFRVLPDMARHTCHNDHGVPFRKECRSTEIPHLFEHLVLELQSQAQMSIVLRGETEWNWRETPRGYFTVSVDYENELLVIGAIKLAERMIQIIDNDQVQALDMTAEIDRLRDLARIGREMEPMTFGFSSGSRSGDTSAELTSRETMLPSPRTRRRVARSAWKNVSIHPDTKSETDPVPLATASL